MIRKEEFDLLGIKVHNELTGNAALEWLAENTTLDIDFDDYEKVKKLPFAAQLFISKFDEIMSKNSLVASESIEGLSQSFNQTDRSALLWDCAEQLLSAHLKGRIKFFSAERKWR